MADSRIVLLVAAAILHSVRAIPTTPLETTPAGGARRPCEEPPSAEVASIRDALVRDNLYGVLLYDHDPHRDENTDVSDRLVSRVSGYHQHPMLSLYGKAAFLTSSQQTIFVWDQAAASTVLPCSWQIDDLGEEFTWITKNSPRGVRVASDSRVLSPKWWNKLEQVLRNSGITLVDRADLVVRDDNATPNGNRVISVQDVRFSGVTWQRKMADLIQGMKVDKMDALVSTSVDDIAWLFNLRGRYYRNSPLFPAFALIVPEFEEVGRSKRVNLYLRHRQLSSEVREHLELENCTDCIKIKPYDEIYDDLNVLSRDTSMTRVLVDKNARQGLLKMVDSTKTQVLVSPISLMKVVKNDVEVAGMKAACLRDSVYVVKMVAEVERKVVNGEAIDEIQAADILASYRRNDDLNRGDAFPTISAYGSHGSIIHFEVTEDTKVEIKDDSLYLLDTGGQYLDGTVDGTRTFHFGQPTAEQKELYTRVLMGVIDVYSTIWVQGRGFPPDFVLLARRHLWPLGYDYGHGSGHGVGQFMNVHEDPINFLRWGWEGLRSYTYKPSVIQAIEPGAYLEGKFGIRLETMGIVTELDDKNTTLDPKSIHRYPRLQFKPIYFIPFEPRMINYQLMTNGQISWLNEYHRKCREILGQELRRRGEEEAFTWLQARTDQVTYNSGASKFLGGSATSLQASTTSKLLLAAIMVMVGNELWRE